MVRLLKIITTIIIFLISHVPISESADLALSKITFYGFFKGEKNVEHYIDDKLVDIKEGETLRHEFNWFDRVDGIITDILDVETTVYNRSKQTIKDIEVRLSVSPKVAYFIYIKDYPEKMWNIEEMERTAEWFAPIILFKRKFDKMDAASSVKVVFEKINLGKIVDGYLKKELWPTELDFTISIEPTGKEETFKNNTEHRILKIPVPVY